MFYYFINLSLSTLLLLSSCAIQQPPKSTGKLIGTAGIFEGNCMPGPGVAPCEPRPLSTTILIAHPSKTYSEDLLVKRISSDTLGNFFTELTEGDYSLFAMDGDQVICSVLLCPDECICNPFKISKDSTTTVNVKLNHASW